MGVAEATAAVAAVALVSFWLGRRTRTSAYEDGYADGKLFGAVSCSRPHALLAQPEAPDKNRKPRATGYVRRIRCDLCGKLCKQKGLARHMTVHR